MNDLKNLQSDSHLPVIILFSIIIALILTSKVTLVRNNNQILGASYPPAVNCKDNQCGFCKKCGGESGINCGKVARCIENNNKYSCQFDIDCIR